VERKNLSDSIFVGIYGYFYSNSNVCSF